MTDFDFNTLNLDNIVSVQYRDVDFRKLMEVRTICHLTVEYHTDLLFKLKNIFYRQLKIPFMCSIADEFSFFKSRIEDKHRKNGLIPILIELSGYDFRNKRIKRDDFITYKKRLCEWIHRNIFNYNKSVIYDFSLQQLISSTVNDVWSLMRNYFLPMKSVKLNNTKKRPIAIPMIENTNISLNTENLTNTQKRKRRRIRNSERNNYDIVSNENQQTHETNTITNQRSERYPHIDHSNQFDCSSSIESNSITDRILNPISNNINANFIPLNESICSFNFKSQNQTEIIQEIKIENHSAIEVLKPMASKPSFIIYASKRRKQIKNDEMFCELRESDKTELFHDEWINMNENEKNQYFNNL